MAESILLSRAASILVAVSVVLSSFTGFLIFAVGDVGQALPSNDSIDGAGDWYIGEEYEQSNKYVQGGWSLSGNLTIRSGGVVVIDGGTLEFAQEYFGPDDARNKVFSLIIEDGGKLVLKNATLTARINDIAYAFPSLGIAVRNGGVFEAYDSDIIASGHLLVDDSTFNLTRSNILGQTTVAGDCDQDHFPVGEFDDSLVILFMSSRVNLFASTIKDIYEPGDENIAAMHDHGYSFAKDVDAANGTRLSANYLLYRMPVAIREDSTVTMQDIKSLLKDDLKSFTVGPNTALWLNGIDTAGLMFSAADGVDLKLNVEYTTSSDYLPSDLKVFYQYRNGDPVETTMSLPSTPVDPIDGVPHQVAKSIDLPKMSAQDLYGLNIGVNNSGTGSVSIDRLWVSVSITLDTYRNITVAGNTDLTAVDTKIEVDMSDDPAVRNRLVLMDDSQAFFYGVYIDDSQTPSPSSKRVYPFITIAETFEATAGSIGAADNTNEEVGNSTDFGATPRYFEVESNEQMSLTEFNTSKIRGAVLAADLGVRYGVSDLAENTQYNQIQWSAKDAVLYNTGIVPQKGPSGPLFSDYSNLYSQGLTDMASINELSIQFVNGDAANAIQFDKVWLDITICPTIYIYRWADITVQDSDGQLVSGAEVSAILQSTEKEAHYYTPDGIRNYPSDEVLKYLGKNSDNYNVTGIDGKVRIPYLSEIKNVLANNSYVNITYGAMVSFKSDLWGDHSKQQNISFQTFTALSQGSTSKSYTVTLDELLIQLPDLSVTSDDISFSPVYVVHGSDVTAYVYVMNQGRLAADNVLVEAYDGTKPLGSATLNVPASGSTYASITWRIDHVGEYPINITVNPHRSVQESNYLNNEASKNITVNIPPGTEDLVIGGSKYPNMTVSGSLEIGGNVRIIENGTLTMNGGALKIVQSGNGTFTLSVSENGALKLINGASFTSDTGVRMFLSADAALQVRDSTIQKTVSITAEGRSELTFDNAGIGAEVTCPINSEAKVVAQNTTFTGAWNNFGGDAVAHLTDVAIPSIEVRQNAKVYIYSWLKVTVWDGSGQPGMLGHVLPDADVKVEYFSEPPVVSDLLSKTTDRNGQAMFKVFRSELTAGKVFNMGSVLIRATYEFDETIYYDDEYASNPEGYTSVSLGAYKDGEELKRGVVPASLGMSSVKPDLDPPIGFSNPMPARGQQTTISTEIVNNGPVDAHNVRVWFNDNTTGKPLFDKVIPVIPKGGQANAVNVSFDWTATVPLGEHEIFLSVDPLNHINEGDETNNNFTRMIKVQGIADLVVQTSGVTFDPSSSVVERKTTIAVSVGNIGDIEAKDVNVTIYAKDPSGTNRVIGTQSISRLLVDSSAPVYVDWTPAMAGVHVIGVVVDGEERIDDIGRGNNAVEVTRSVLDYPDLRATNVNFSPASPVNVNDDITVTASVTNVGGVPVSNVVVNFYFNEVSSLTRFYQATIPSIAAWGTATAIGYMTAELGEGVIEEERKIIAVVNPDKMIKEAYYDNNNATQYLTIVENRPDIIFTGDIHMTKDGSPVDTASVGETVVMSTSVRNNGASPAYGVLFVFYAVDEMYRMTEIGTVVKDFGIGQAHEINVTWAINVTMGEYTLVVSSNPDRTVEEIDDTQDIVSLDFTVAAPNTVIKLNDLSKTSYKPGDSVFITGTVTNKNTTKAVSGALVEVWLVKDGVMIGGKLTGTTDASGGFLVSVYLNQGLDGDYVVSVEVSIGGKSESTSQTVQVKAAPEGGIPWYVYLLIFALVSAVIIAFSAYLYKYGLGRMVECGECGALIPEASKRCPKCGVQFEPGTAKCSECNAWIPSNSTQCPECGIKFITEAIEEEEGAHIKKMREQYESYVDTYREEAKIEMGRKYSDARFPTWWKKHPAFISFEQWLSQEEEKLKSGGSLCPVCATHNPRGSPICQKCGSTLEVPKAPAEPVKEEPPRKPLRRIVRRPVGKTETPADPQVKSDKAEGHVEPRAEGDDKPAVDAPAPADEAAKSDELKP